MTAPDPVTLTAEERQKFAAWLRQEAATWQEQVNREIDAPNLSRYSEALFTTTILTRAVEYVEQEPRQ